LVTNPSCGSGHVNLSEVIKKKKKKLLGEVVARQKFFSLNEAIDPS